MSNVYPFDDYKHMAGNVRSVCCYCHLKQFLADEGDWEQNSYVYGCIPGICIVEPYVGQKPYPYENIYTSHMGVLKQNRDKWNKLSDEEKQKHIVAIRKRINNLQTY